MGDEGGLIGRRTSGRATQYTPPQHTAQSALPRIAQLHQPLGLLRAPKDPPAARVLGLG